jgi:hypothetical protein
MNQNSRSAVVNAVKRSVSPYAGPELRARRLWLQHCSWCPRCNPKKPGCELGRKSHDLYDWLAQLLTQQRAG